MMGEELLLTGPGRFQGIEDGQRLEKGHGFVIFPFGDFSMDSTKSLIHKIQQRVAMEIYASYINISRQNYRQRR
jgi:hypothetical protein